MKFCLTDISSEVYCGYTTHFIRHASDKILPLARSLKTFRLPFSQPLIYYLLSSISFFHVYANTKNIKIFDSPVFYSPSYNM